MGGDVFRGPACRRPSHGRRPDRRDLPRGPGLRPHLPAGPGQREGLALRRRPQRRLLRASPGRRETRRDLRISGRRLLEPDDIARLEDKLDAESPDRRALAALERLPEGERAVLELIAVDQLTVTEAAAALGIRQVTARVRLHRARKALRAQTCPPTEDKHGTALSYVIEGTGGEA